MKAASILFTALVFVSCFTCYGREWKNRKGDTLEAELVSVEDGYIRLKKSDGKEIRVSVNALSDKDVVYLDSKNLLPKASAKDLRINVAPMAVAKGNRGDYNLRVNVSNSSEWPSENLKLEWGYVDAQAIINISSEGGLTPEAQEAFFKAGDDLRKQRIFVLGNRTIQVKGKSYLEQAVSLRTMGTIVVSGVGSALYAISGKPEWVVILKDSHGRILQMKASSRNAEQSLMKK